MDSITKKKTTKAEPSWSLIFTPLLLNLNHILKDILIVIGVSATSDQLLKGSKSYIFVLFT